MLVTLTQKLAACFEAERLQAVELLIQMLGANSHSWFHNLGQPCLAVTGSVDRAAAAGYRPAAIQRFDPIHHPSRILSDRQITAPQLLQAAHTMLAVVDRLQLIGTEQFRELAGVHSITL